MSHAAEHRLVVLMFTDLVDSSAMKTRLGDLAYADSVARPHNGMFRSILSSIEGAEENNYTGDGFLATFLRASDAVEAALRFQDAMRSHAWAAGAPRTRVGIHVGEVALIEGSEAGRMLIASHAADMCARLMGLGGGGQILLTRHAFDDGRQYVRCHPPVAGAGGPPALEWRAHGRYRFKGKDDDPLEVFEVGAKGLAPLAVPKDSEKAHRVLDADEEQLLGWRPAAGLEVPRREGWTLQKKLGEGGFGEVWLGQHAKTKERRVFKFCFDADRLRSFRRELTLFRLLRETLGDRKDIGRLHEVQLDHSPYFLEGEFTPEGDLRAWSDAQGGIRALPLATRLDLVARTAEAVAAAHGVGVLHKDLKPGNILVYAAEDGSPRPRITDFGIGILTDPSLLSRHGITVAGFTAALTENESSRTGTRMYAPPEQLVGAPFTTQGDVYALGVLLLQMVVGDLDLPLASGWERGGVAAVQDALVRELLLGDIARMVDGDPARRGSAADAAERLRTLDARREALERERQVERDRAAAERRVAEEQARRIRTRQRAVVVVGVLILLLGIASIFVVRERELRKEAEGARGREATARGMAETREKEAARARADAEDRARELRQVSEFQARMLENVDAVRMGHVLREDLNREILRGAQRVHAADPTRKAPVSLEESLGAVNFTDVAVRSIDVNVLKPALAAIDKEFADQPLVRARLLDTVALTLRSLGLYDAAKTPAERALEIRRRELGADHEDTLRSLLLLGEVHAALGKVDESEACNREALERGLRAFGADHEVTIIARISMGASLHAKGQSAQAEEPLRLALDSARRTLGAGDTITLTALSNLATLLGHLQREDEALDLRRAGLEVATRALSPDDLHLLRLRGDYATTLVELGRYDEAEPIVRDVLERRRRTLGDNHSETFLSLSSLANLMHRKGMWWEAVTYYRATRDGRDRVLGGDHPDTLNALANLASALCEVGELAEAEACLRASLEGRRRVLGPRHPKTIDSLGALGHVIAAQGRIEEGEKLLREALDARRSVRGENHPDEIYDLANLSLLLADAGRFDEAVVGMRRVVDCARETFGDPHRMTVRMVGILSSILLRSGRTDEAEKALRESMEGIEQALGRNDPKTASARVDLASLLVGAGRYGDAEALIKDTLGAIDEADAARFFVHLYTAWESAEPGKGHAASAEAWRAKLK